MGSFATKGARQTMEDTYFLKSKLGEAAHVHTFGVFDGHRGPEAAEFAAVAIPQLLVSKASSPSPRDALIRAFMETDSSFRQELDVERKFKKSGGTDWHPGCTATTALPVHDKLFVANAGDCRTIICRKGMTIPLSKVPELKCRCTLHFIMKNCQTLHFIVKNCQTEPGGRVPDAFKPLVVARDFIPFIATTKKGKKTTSNLSPRNSHEKNRSSQQSCGNGR